MPTVSCPACGAWHVDVDADGNIRQHSHRSGAGFCTGEAEQPEPAPERGYHVRPYEEQKRIGINFPRGVCSRCKGNYGLNKDNTIRKHDNPTIMDEVPCGGTFQPSLGLPDKTED